MKPPLTLADLSPQVRLHLPASMLDPEDSWFDRFDYVSARIVHGVAVLKDKDGDMERYYLGYEIEHNAYVSSGYYDRWSVGGSRGHGDSTLEGCKRWVDQRILLKATKAGGTP